MIAWLPDEPMLYDKLDPLEYLEFVSGLWGVDPERAQKNANELLRVPWPLAAPARALRGLFARA